MTLDLMIEATAILTLCLLFVAILAIFVVMIGMILKEANISTRKVKKTLAKFILISFSMYALYFVFAHMSSVFCLELECQPYIGGLHLGALLWTLGVGAFGWAVGQMNANNW